MTIEQFNELKPGDRVRMNENKCYSDFHQGDIIILKKFYGYSEASEMYYDGIFSRVDEEVPIRPYVRYDEIEHI